MAYSVIDKAVNFFGNTILYTGTGASNAQTGVGFQPDITWLKARSATTDHYLFDAVRGATKGIFPNSTEIEATNAEYLKSFDSDGFTVGTNAGVNNNTVTYVGWNWKAGTTSVPSGGTITPSGVSYNATSKCGIYTWAGTGSNGTIAHGLSGTPTMMIVKQLNSTAGWQVYHQALGATKVMYLNSTADADTSSTVWNDTAPTDTVFTVGTNNGTNASGSTYVGYVFCDVPGYQLCGQYQGNGQAIGSVALLGFRPIFVMIKKVGTGQWQMFDDNRDGYNRQNDILYASSTGSESDGDEFIDFYSNGFKITTNNSEINADTALYNYIAIGQPAVGSSNVVATAR